MSDKQNPLAVQQIRAAGTPMPGERQQKDKTKKQKASGNRNDMVMHKLQEHDEILHKIDSILQQLDQHNRVGSLERHVCLQLIAQNVCGEDVIRELMAERAENFGLSIKYGEEKVDEGQESESSETDNGSENVSKAEEFEGVEGYNS